MCKHGCTKKCTGSTFLTCKKLTTVPLELRGSLLQANTHANVDTAFFYKTRVFTHTIHTHMHTAPNLNSHSTYIHMLSINVAHTNILFKIVSNPNLAT